MALYGTFIYNTDDYGDDSGGSLPIEITGERVPWIFQGYDSEDIYEFAINPLECSVPSIQKQISTQNTAAGGLVYFQGQNTVPSMSFSGTILSEAHYTAMKTWSGADKQVAVIDDLGRKYWVYIKNFSPTRQYHPEYPWRHEFSVEAVILDWPS